MLARTTIAVAIALLAATTAAQDDMRDRITRIDGKVIAGRVVMPTATDRLLVMQGGKRVRVECAEVATVELVGDAVREFCQRRVKLENSARAQWFLVDWAESQGLTGLARAQAMLLALDSDHEEAHEFLGHRKTKKGWLWLHEGRHLDRDRFEERVAKKGLTITGERFTVHSHGRLRACVAALLDLEHLGVVWYEHYGAALQLEETLRPILIDVIHDAEDFPKWGFRPVPFYTPPPHGDVGRTFFVGGKVKRPDRLFFIGTQGLLYRSLIGEVNRQSDRDRVCAWLEVGLGMYLEHTMQGTPGYAAPGTPQLKDHLALTALGRSFRLSSLLHLPMYGGYYLMDDTATAVHWAASTMFTAWLLDKDNKPATREPFLAFIREALGNRKGDSSSVFDKAMGRRIEDMEEPWSEWLTKMAGY